jgi:hypothetical protein
MNELQKYSYDPICSQETFMMLTRYSSMSLSILVAKYYYH